MNNLFSIFDPNVNWANIRLNWVRSLIVILWIPRIFWLTKSKIVTILSLTIKSLAAEYRLNFAPVNSPGHTHWAITLFLIILLNNLAGLTPYTFTATSHLSFSVRIALTMWVGYYMLYRQWFIYKDNFYFYVIVKKSQYSKIIFKYKLMTSMLNLEVIFKQN